MDINKMIQESADKEKALLKSTFVSPIKKGTQIKVRINGLVYTFNVIEKDKDKEGWFVFKPVNPYCAKIVKDVDAMQMQEYKNMYRKLLPRIRFIMVANEEGQWLGFPSDRGQALKHDIDGYQFIDVVEGVQVFDQAYALFDGKTLWFDEVDMNANLMVIDYMRESLSNNVAVDKLKFKGMTPEQIGTYAFAYEYKIKAEEELKAKTVEERIRRALDHAGAKMKAFREYNDTVVVDWQTKKGKYTTRHKKDDGFSTVAAGVCLSDRDDDYDLASLVSVMLEREKKGINANRFQDDDDVENILYLNERRRRAYDD